MKDWNINVSVFVGIENNISICYKFQNDFNDYFQDKNNKGNNNENFNKNNNENKYIANINSDNCKGIFIDSNYDDYFCKDF